MKTTHYIIIAVVIVILVFVLIYMLNKPKTTVTKNSAQTIPTSTSAASFDQLFSQIFPYLGNNTTVNVNTTSGHADGDGCMWTNTQGQPQVGVWDKNVCVPVILPF